MKKLQWIVYLFLCCCSLLSAGEPIRILAVGNSFSADVAETYLHDIAAGEGVTFIIGSAAIGGCSLETHWNNAQKDLPNYGYTKIEASGEKSKKEKVTLLEAVRDEPWDYIVFQQVSYLSGMYDTYFPYIKNLTAYVKAYATNPDFQCVMHMTWAYAKKVDHFGYKNYDNDQSVMHRAIVNTVFKAAETLGIEIIIPSGTAVRNVREAGIGNDLCSDGFHLNETGKYIAGITWYSKLTGKKIKNNTFTVDGISSEEKIRIQKAVSQSIANPRQL